MKITTNFKCAVELVDPCQLPASDRDWWQDLIDVDSESEWFCFNESYIPMCEILSVENSPWGTGRPELKDLGFIGYHHNGSFAVKYDENGDLEIHTIDYSET